MFDFKKEQKELYKPKNKPHIIDIPKMNFIAFKGMGDPNEEYGEYKKSITLLYGVAYTLKMSYRSKRKIDGFFEYVVPPLEGFWWIEGLKGMDYSRKNEFTFISLIRIPEFIKEEDVKWAIEVISKKKNIDYSKVYYMTYNEQTVVQCMHNGPYDDEPETVDQMHKYIKDNGYELDFSKRYHHEIYIGDPRKVDPNKLKTIIRHPIKIKDNKL